jgi:hypothetical protein
MVQTRFGFAAAVIDGKRIRIDQRLPHGFGGSGTVGERSAADPARQRGITVATGNLRDRSCNRTQCSLAVPRRANGADKRHGKSGKQTTGQPSRQRR